MQMIEDRAARLAYPERVDQFGGTAAGKAIRDQRRALSAFFGLRRKPGEQCGRSIGHLPSTDEPAMNGGGVAARENNVPRAGRGHGKRRNHLHHPLGVRLPGSRRLAHRGDAPLEQR